MPLTWFDAHLDLAYLAVHGRDMLAALDPGAAPHPPAAVTLPALAAANVRFMLATIFTEPIEPGITAAPEQYPAGDVDRAAAVGRAQLEAYLTWRDRGRLGLDLAAVFAADPGVGQVRGGMGVSEPVPFSPEQRLAKLPSKPSVHAGILIENADPIRSPEELGWWRDRGVCAIGLAWHRPSRYAGGNSTETGLTDLGRALLREMDRLGVVADASHLSDRSLEELLDATQRPIIASHSNCRSLLEFAEVPRAFQQRHLADAAVRRISERGGVIGLNLFSAFLSRRCFKEGRATIDEAIAHVDHLCSLVGHTRSVGLGSDMDGGFSAGRLPEGINSPADLPRLAEALSARGWSDEEVAGFAWRNWAEFWSRSGLSRSGRA